MKKLMTLVVSALSAAVSFGTEEIPAFEYPENSFVWIGGENGDWATAGNWSTGKAPSSNSSSTQNPVVLQNGSLVEGYPNNNQTRFTCDVYFGPNFSWTRKGSYLFFNGYTLYFYGGTLINESGSLVWSQTTRHRISMHGGTFINKAGNWNAFTLYGGEALKGGRLEVSTTIAGGVEFEGTILKGGITLNSNVGVTLRHGRLVATGATATGVSFGTGSYVDFPTGATGVLSLPACSTTAGNAFTKLGGYLRLDGAAVDAETFAEKFAVTASPDSADGMSGLAISLKHDGAAVLCAEPYDAPFDARQHRAIRAYLGYPLETDCAFQYKVGDGDWSDEMPVVRDVGEYAVTVRATPDGGLAAVEKSFTAVVTTRDLASCATIAPVGSQAKTGEELKPEPAVTDERFGALVKGRDFDYAYEDNVEVGMAKVFAVGKGNYSGRLVTEFEIKDLAAALTEHLHGNSFTYVCDGVTAFTMPGLVYDGDDAAEVTLKYCDTPDGEFAETPPAISEAGRHTVYCRAYKGDVYGTAKATVTLMPVMETGTVYYWTGTAGDNKFTTAGNWSVNGAPATAAPNVGRDIIVIQNGTVDINITQPMFLKALYIATGANVSFSGRWLHVQGGGTLHVWGGEFNDPNSFVWGQAGNGGSYPADWCYIDMLGGTFTAASLFGNDPFFIPDGSRLSGGTIRITDATSISFKGSSDLKGTTLNFAGLTGASNARLVLYKGKVLCRSSLTLNNGSALDFKPYSLASVSLPFTTLTKAQVYSTYFATGKMLYDGAVIPEEDFNRMFVVGASPDSATGATGTEIKLDTSDLDEIKTVSTPYAGEWDGAAHPSVNHFVSFPGDTTVTYQLGNGDWTEDVPEVSDAGEYALKVKTVDNEGNFEDRIDEHTVTVTTRDLAKHATIEVLANYSWTGEEVRPEPTVTDDLAGVLAKGDDYAVSYANNVDVGTATVTATGCGNYGGSVSTTFEIVSVKAMLEAGFKAEDRVFTVDGRAHIPSFVYSGEREGEVSYVYSLSPDGPWVSEVPVEWTTAGERTVWSRVCLDGVYAERSAKMTVYPMPTIVEPGPTNIWIGGDGDFDVEANWSLGHVPYRLAENVVVANGTCEIKKFQPKFYRGLYLCQGGKVVTTTAVQYFHVESTATSPTTLHLCGGELDVSNIAFLSAQQAAGQNNPDLRGRFDFRDGTFTLNGIWQTVALQPGATLTGGVLDWTKAAGTLYYNGTNTLKGTVLKIGSLAPLTEYGEPLFRMKAGKVVATGNISGRIDLVGAKAVVSLPKSTKSAAQVYQDYFATGLVTVQGRVITEEEFAKRIVLTASPDSADGTTGVAFSMKPTGLLLMVW